MAESYECYSEFEPGLAQPRPNPSIIVPCEASITVAVFTSDYLHPRFLLKARR